MVRHFDSAMEENLNVLKSRTGRLRALNEDLKRETGVLGAKMKDYYTINDWLCRSDFVLQDVDSLLAESTKKMSDLGVGGFSFTRFFEMNKFQNLVVKRRKQVEHLIHTCVFDTSTTTTTVKDHSREGAIQNPKCEQELRRIENDIEENVRSSELWLRRAQENSHPGKGILPFEDVKRITTKIEEYACNLEKNLVKRKEDLAKGVAMNNSKGTK